MYKMTIKVLTSPSSWVPFSYSLQQPFCAILDNLQANSKFRTLYMLSNYPATLLPDTLIDFFHHTGLIKGDFHLTKIATPLVNQYSLFSYAIWLFAVYVHLLVVLCIVFPSPRKQATYHWKLTSYSLFCFYSSERKHSRRSETKKEKTKLRN